MNFLVNRPVLFVALGTAVEVTDTELLFLATTANLRKTKFWRDLEKEKHTYFELLSRFLNFLTASADMKMLRVVGAEAKPFGRDRPFILPALEVFDVRETVVHHSNTMAVITMAVNTIGET